MKKEETIYDIVIRISETTPYSFDVVKDVYLSNESEEQTIELLNIATAGNISVYSLIDACMPPSPKLHELYPSRWTKIKRKLRRIIKAIYILFERYGRFVHDRYDNGFYTRSDN